MCDLLHFRVTLAIFGFSLPKGSIEHRFRGPKAAGELPPRAASAAAARRRRIHLKTLVPHQLRAPRNSRAVAGSRITELSCGTGVWHGGFAVQYGDTGGSEKAPHPQPTTHTTLCSTVV